jgi:hypothetical protein
MRAYHAFIQAGVVAQGLLQYLAVAAPKLVWSSFGSWLRTIRPGIPPSEFVVAKALRQTLPEFLMGPAKSDSLTKFIAERQDEEFAIHFDQPHLTLSEPIREKAHRHFMGQGFLVRAAQRSSRSVIRLG